MGAFGIDKSDPNAVAGEFDQFPEGEVVVNGIEAYIKVDDEGIPFYSERDGKPYAMLRLRLADGSKEGPPLSCSPAQLAMVVSAFAGIDALALLPKDRESVQYLLRVKQLANCEAPEQSGKQPFRQTAYVGKAGYVKNVSGMDLPVNQFFRFVVDDVRNLDGSADPIKFILHEKFHQEVVSLRFRVTGDMNGGPTIYDGATVHVLLENPFAGSDESTTPDGATKRMPVFKINSNKSKPKSVARIINLVNVFCPEINDHDWVADSARSPYGTNEAENPMIVIADYLRRGSRVGIARLSQSQKSKINRVKLDILDFVAAEGGRVPMGNPAPARAKLIELYKVINEIVATKTGKPAFQTSTEPFPGFSDEGVAWAKEFMLPVWVDLKLPEEHVLVGLSEDQAESLMGELLTRYLWAKKETAKAEEKQF